MTESDGAAPAAGRSAALDPPLDPVEARVLGSLMEKQVATPDSYPLTLNALLAACNQTTNRFPVARYGEHEVGEALASLRQRGLTRIVYSTSNRAPKHRHVADEVLDLSPAEQAAVCVLLLRGPQTVGEVKGRTERLHAFADLAETEATLEALAARPVPLVARLPRQPGQKEERYTHLLGEPGPVEAAGVAEARDGRPGGVAGLTMRVEALEVEVAALRELVERLRPLVD